MDQIRSHDDWEPVFGGPEVEPDPDPDPAPGLPLVAHPDMINELIQRLEPKRVLPTALFRIRPWGRHMIVVREPSVGQIGSIVVPDDAKQPQSRGYVVSVGPLVGLPNHGPGALGWCPYPRHHLLGQRLLFGAHAGTAIAVGEDLTLNKDNYTIRLGGVGRDGLPNTSYQGPYMFLADSMILGEWPFESDIEVPNSATAQE